ncbi:MAG: hypothetical protein EB053_00700 [Chlamydiae bacterium]|nr:hypothetical protein [Chlamydiota bacterium]
MTPFRKTGQLYQALFRSKPTKLVEKALTHLKNYQPSKDEELAHTSLLASAYALTSMYSLELSDAIKSVHCYDKLLSNNYPLKQEDWLKLSQVYIFIYEKTQNLEQLEKAVYAGNLSSNSYQISKVLLELYLKVRDEETFNLCLEKCSRYLLDKPNDLDLIFIRAELYFEYGLRNKQTRFLQLSLEEYEKIVALHPNNQKAKSLSVATSAFLSLFLEDAEKLSESIYKSQLLSEHTPLELYAKGVSSLCYAIYSSDLDELQAAIHFLQHSHLLIAHLVRDGTIWEYVSFYFMRR